MVLAIAQRTVTIHDFEAGFRVLKYKRSRLLASPSPTTVFCLQGQALCIHAISTRKWGISHAQPRFGIPHWNHVRLQPFECTLRRARSAVKFCTLPFLTIESPPSLHFTLLLHILFPFVRKPLVTVRPSDLHHSSLSWSGSHFDITRHGGIISLRR